ncbi:hypothetical protein [Paracoccus sp. (in: a-proteobacteria)]|uniref:hypothetical protein n=1 Tax=Paracoccus sp. TaxID=267 RepID=UPI004058ADD1
MSDWNYQEQPYKEIDDNRYLGFIYRIDNLTNGRSYIGQKMFYNRRGKTYTESDWRTYTGSNKALNKDIEAGHQIIKTIIQFCREKNEMNYREAEAIIMSNALLDEMFYNDWINAKITNKGNDKWRAVA